MMLLTIVSRVLSNFYRLFEIRFENPVNFIKKSFRYILKFQILTQSFKDFWSSKLYNFRVFYGINENLYYNHHII